MEQTRTGKNAFHITITGDGYWIDGQIYNTLRLDIYTKYGNTLYFTGIHNEAHKNRIAATNIPENDYTQHIIYKLEGHSNKDIARSLFKALANTTFAKENYYIEQINLTSGEIDENGDTIRFRLKKNHTDYIFEIIKLNKDKLNELFATYDDENPFESGGLEGEDDEENEDGFFIKNNVANIQLPADISLASNPNFVQFQKMGTQPEEEKLPTVTIQIVDHWPYTPPKFSIIESRTGNANPFVGVAYPKTPKKNEFNYGGSAGGIDANAYMLAECLRRNEFLSNNFHITVRSSHSNEGLVDLTLKSWDSNYLFVFEFENSFLQYAYVNKENHALVVKDDEMVIEVKSPTYYPSEYSLKVLTITDKNTEDI